MSVIFALLALLPALRPQPNAAPGEPTSAEAAAAQKEAADRAVDARYAAWVASLPPEQHAWERVLQENLGGFYLPLHERDKIAGRSNAWDFVHDDPKLPRVLLIGDSVSRGYTQPVRDALTGKANVHRAPANCGPTATGVNKLETWLGDGKWKIIHFNFGLHDSRTPLADYEARLRKIVTRLQATGARLIWASTTPRPADAKEGPSLAQAVVERNEVAARIMKEQGIPIDDLFVHVSPHLAQVQNPKDVHFNAEGYQLLGRRVAAAIVEALE